MKAEDENKKMMCDLILRQSVFQIKHVLEYFSQNRQY